MKFWSQSIIAISLAINVLGGDGNTSVEENLKILRNNTEAGDKSYIPQWHDLECEVNYLTFNKIIEYNF